MSSHLSWPGPVLLATTLVAVPALGSDYVTYTNESSVRLDADNGVVLVDPEEKDYDFADVDHDGDTDLAVVRKQPFTTAGGRRNVLLMNVGGVLTDMTAEFAPEFLDATNDRDVKLVDVNNDGWADMVTAAACNSCNPGGITDDSRLYFNLGQDGGGNWLGFGTPVVLFGGGNNFCAVAAGDVDGDGYADLYFASYNDNFEDQMLMNEGAANPGSFVNGNNRLTTAMRTSGFGSNVVMEDMDNDNDLDIIKSENGPVEIFRNNGSGVFDLLDPTYSGAAYHVGVGDLNNDGLMDVVISDDGTDRGIINNGNIINGAADATFAFPASTAGFGSNSYMVDLDHDGWREVLIADVDVDAGGCDRISDILRNVNANFTDDPANIPAGLLQGVHDIAVFDIDGDTWEDIVIGRCGSTQVWINSPPSFVEFGYPNGIPEFVPPGGSSEVAVQMNVVGGTIVPGTETLHVSVNDGPYTQSPLSSLGGGNYEGTLNGTQCADTIDFFISVQLESGLSFRDPPSAPAQTYEAFVATGIELYFEDDVEGDTSGWTVENDPSLTSGAWEPADPNPTFYIGQIAAPGEDTTPDGVMAWVTQNGPPGAPASGDDVDGGPTTLYTPIFDLTGQDGFVSYSIWAFSDSGLHDTLEIEISNDGGKSWIHVETLADTDSDWESRSFFVSNFVPPTSLVQMRFVACDCPNDSITEAGLDDFRIDALTCDKVPCPWDLDGSGGIDTIDFLDLLAQWGTNPGGPPDFNGDGAVDTIDFLELLSNWGGCP